MVDNKTSPLKPAQSIQINSSETPQLNQESDSGDNTDKPDERYKYFFRVKIGGSSQPENTNILSNATFTGSASIETFTNQEPAPGPQANTTDLSKTSDRFSFGNPFAPPNNQAKFTNTFNFNQSATQEDLLKSIASNKIEIVQPEATANTAQFSLLSAAENTPVTNENLPDTARELIFDSLKGEILGKPYFRSCSDQYSSVKFTIYDPDDTFRTQINKLENVEIEAGFVNGYKRNIFVGKLLDVGRKLPDGTVIEAVDNSYPLQQTTSGANPSTPTNATTLTPDTNTTSTTESTSGDYAVKSSFTGEASFYGKNDGFAGKPTANGEKFDPQKLTAAHKTLPFGTLVRVTNVKNNKKVIVQINDRGPYSGGRVMDLSVAAAEALDMISSGVAQVKAEVLDKKQENTQQTPTATKAKDSTISQIKSQPTFQRSNGESQFVRKSNAEAFTIDVPGLKFAQTSFSELSKQGEILFQQSKMASAEMEAALTGKVLVTSGNTLISVAPGEGRASGVTLDYATNRAAFIDYPVISKRTNLTLQPATGSLTVQGYDSVNKQVIGATVVTPGEVKQHPTGIIQAPEWGKIKLNDPIYPGTQYTWADATKNGSRVPESKEIMQGIIRIAQIITEMTKETGQTKWKINSWYRPASVNRAKGGSSSSRHLSGDAVDFYFPNEGVFFAFYRKLQETWPGGVALGNRPKFNPPFIHVDARHQMGKSRARWNY